MSQVRRSAPLTLVLMLVVAAPAAGQEVADPTEAPGLCPVGHRVVGLEGTSEDTATPEPLTTPAPLPGDPAAGSLTALGGSWSKLPRSPFSAVNAVALWAGDRMVAIDPASGRTATYQPVIHRWEEHQPIPGASEAPTWLFDGIPTTVSTDDEVILVGDRTEPDGESRATVHLAFDPASGRWRDLAPSPLEGAGSLAWTGELLVEVAGRHAAAYDPTADCWLLMPGVPLPEPSSDGSTLGATGWSVRQLAWTEDELLAVVHNEEPEVGLGVVSFDPKTWTWDAGPQGPLASQLTSAILVDDRLWFMNYRPNDRWLTNGTYDPATETWTLLDTGCRLDAGAAFWSGRSIMNPLARRAYDPATGACYHLPKLRDRARYVRDTVWTGRESIVWSGSWGDSGIGRPDGVVYRPPRESISTEPARAIGPRLERAIKARRKLGFDTDPDVVRAIMREPWQPGTREFSVPMTEDEYWAMNDRSWFSSQLEPLREYVQPLPLYGGEWIDHRAGGRLAIALTEAPPDVIAGIDALMPTEPALGWKLVIVKRSDREMRAAQRRAPTVVEKLDPAAGLGSWGVDVKNGAVTLMFDPDDVERMRARKKELEKALGVPVRITSGRVGDV